MNSDNLGRPALAGISCQSSGSVPCKTATIARLGADIGDAINTACRNKSEILRDIFGIKTVGCMFAKDATLFIGQRQWPLFP